MSNFACTTVNLGEQSPGVTKLVQYSIITNQEVDHFNTTCSCTGAMYDKPGNRVYLNFKIGDIPQHLLGTKSLPQNRIFEVVFKNGDKENLEIKYTIVKR